MASIFTEHKLHPLKESDGTDTKSEISDRSHITKVFISLLRTFSLISSEKRESGGSYASHTNLLASARLNRMGK